LDESEGLSGSPPAIALVGLSRSALVFKLRKINLPKWLRSGNFIGDYAWPASTGKDKSDRQYPSQTTRLTNYPLDPLDIAHEARIESEISRLDEHPIIVYSSLYSYF
jgi:hypothetical protein